MNYHLVGLIGLLFASILNVQSSFFSKTPPVLKEVYWGPGEQANNTDNSIRPFKVKFDKQMIKDLKYRLSHTRELQPSLEKVGWSYGVNSKFVPSIIYYWLNKYDFQKREKHLNQFPQFITNIEGLDIHFIHVKPKVPNNGKIKVFPLYIQHGWPGSVVEFFDIIPMLTTVRPDRNFVFEVVAPTLPGFGYSSAAAKPGLGPDEISYIMKNLMLRLGFTKWYAEGADWGFPVASSMAVSFPEHILGLHSSFCLAVIPDLTTTLKTTFNLLLSQEARKNLADYLIIIFQEVAYVHEQATKPESLGVGLSDSPAALAAYILEKFAAGSASLKLRENKYYPDDSNLLEKFNMDALLDNVMLYWAPNKATTSMRIYAEYFSERNLLRRQTILKPIEVPSACVQFPAELLNVPEEILRNRFVNLVSFTKMPRGGHFGAMEEPKLLADDIWASVEKMRNYTVPKKCYNFLFFSFC